MLDNPHLIVTAPCEGGLFSLRRDMSAPIRIFSDGRVEDDYTGIKRPPFSAEELQIILVAASSNDAMMQKATAYERL